MQREKMLLVFNPVAGSGAFAEHLYEVVDCLTRGGFEVTVWPTTHPGEAFEIVKARGPSFDRLVCSGGDGTLGEVVDALMELEQPPLLGYIPSGTTNDFAYSHDLPTDPLLGAKTVLEGEPVSLDVGGFQQGYFTYVAAFGLFTDVSYGTPQGMKNMFGHAAYILRGIRQLASIRDIPCTVECDGEVIEGEFILGMVANSKSVAGFHLPAGIDLHMDDGRFEVILLRKIAGMSELQDVVSVLTGLGQPGNAFVVRSARHVHVRCNEPLAWALDGEFGGEHTEVDIRVHRQAVRMLVPREEHVEAEDDNR